MTIMPQMALGKARKDPSCTELPKYFQWNFTFLVVVSQVLNYYLILKVLT